MNDNSTIEITLSKPAAKQYGRAVHIVDTPAEVADHGIPFEDAQKQLDSVLQNTVRGALNAGQHTVISLGVSVGVGKTSRTASMVKQLLDSSSPKRVLWLATTKKLRNETAEHFKHQHQIRDGVVIVYARSSDESDPGYCQKYDECQAVGSKRQNVIDLICRQCECRPSCAYLAQRRRANKARVVLATHSAYLSDPSLLMPFDLIVIDESAFDALLDEITITYSHYCQWVNRIDPYHYHDKYMYPVLNPLRKALTFEKFDEDYDLVHHGRPLLTSLRIFNTDIVRAAKTVVEMIEMRQHGRNCMETKEIDHPIPGESLTAASVPMAGFFDLLKMLAAENANAPTCWLFPASGNGNTNYIRLYRLRTEIIRALQSRVTVLLDATPPRRLYELIFGDALINKTVTAESYQHVTLFTESLFKLKHVDVDGSRDQWNKKAIERLMALCCQRYSRPLVVTPKRLNDVLCFPENTEHTHFGAADTRGSNKYMNCDAIIIIGHHQVPYDEQIRRASAARRVNPDQLVRSKCPDFQTHSETVPIDGFRLSDETSLTYTIQYPIDADASMIAKQSYAAEIIQIIGRLRLSHPERKAKPVPVLLLIGEPPQGVNIDEVTTLPKWIEQHDREWLAQNPLPRRRQTNASPVSQGNLTRSNAARGHDALTRIAASIRDLQEHGEKISINRVAKHAKASRNTVTRYFQDHPDLLLSAQAEKLLI